MICAARNSADISCTRSRQCFISLLVLDPALLFVLRSKLVPSSLAARTQRAQDEFTFRLVFRSSAPTLRRFANRQSLGQHARFILKLGKCTSTKSGLWQDRSNPIDAVYWEHPEFSISAQRSRSLQLFTMARLKV